MITFDRDFVAAINAGPTIKVIGVGGAGGNMVNSIIECGAKHVECIVANTDAQALAQAKSIVRIQLGVEATKGLGTGANAELGKIAAEEDLEKVLEACKDADVVFLTGGLGGGTGSGALPVIAHALRERNILTIAVVTKPFDFEGKKRMAVANTALELLKQEVDTLIVVPNQKLIEIADKKVSLVQAFSMVNALMYQCVKSIADIIANPGHINVDFADVKAIVKNMGLAIMGTGIASGQDRAQKAAHLAISSPLLENMSIKGARGVLLNISGSSQLGLHEVSAVASIIHKEVHEDATIILGSVIDDTLGDEVSVTVIATGFEQVAQEVSEEVRLEEPSMHQPKMMPFVAALEAKEVKPAPLAAQQTAGAQAEKKIDTHDIEVPTILRRMVIEKQQQNVVTPQQKQK